MIRSTRVIVFVLCAGVLLFARAPTHAATPLDPCKLVTLPAASRALGVPAQPGVAGSMGMKKSCRYYAADHTKNVFVQVPIAAGEFAMLSKMGAKPVAGVGAQAFWYAGSVFIKKGAEIAQVGLYLSATSMTQMDPALVPLARSAAQRM